MSKRLSSTIGTRINEYDNLAVQTVGMFNVLFPECPVKGFEQMLFKYCCIHLENFGTHIY